MVHNFYLVLWRCLVLEPSYHRPSSQRHKRNTNSFQRASLTNYKRLTLIQDPLEAIGLQISWQPPFSKDGHHRAPHSSRQPAREFPRNFRGPCASGRPLQLSIFRPVFPYISVLTGVSPVSRLLRPLLGCTPQTYEACACPASRPKKEPGVSNRDISGLTDSGTLTCLKRDPGATPHRVPDSRQDMAAGFAWGWGAGGFPVIGELMSGGAH